MLSGVGLTVRIVEQLKIGSLLYEAGLQCVLEPKLVGIFSKDRSSAAQFTRDAIQIPPLIHTVPHAPEGPSTLGQ